MVVRSNIKRDDGISALDEYLNQRITKSSPVEEITPLMQYILALNNVNVNDRNLMQTKGCAMGIVATHLYVTMYMDKFENTNISEIKNDCLFYARYINDISIIYTYREAKRNNFLINLNMMQDSIKFDHKKST